MPCDAVLDDARPSPPAQEESAHSLLTCLAEALGRCDRARGARIARARTSVQFAVVDPATGRRDGPVLRCEGPMPSFAMDDGPAETRIFLSPDQARRFCAGRLHLATALVEGEVRASGPARRFLVVEPILRALIAERSGS